MRFSTPVVLATLAILATVQAAPAGGEDKGAPAMRNKSVDLDDQEINLPGDLDVPPKKDDVPVVDDLDIEECLDDPELEECADIIGDFDVPECLEEFSRGECLHKLKDYLKHHHHEA